MDLKGEWRFLVKSMDQTFKRSLSWKKLKTLTGILIVLAERKHQRFLIRIKKVQLVSKQLSLTTFKLTPDSLEQSMSLLVQETFNLLIVKSKHP